MLDALIWLEPGCCRETVSAQRVGKEAGVISRGGDASLSLPLSLHSTCSSSRWDQEGGVAEGKGRVQHRHAWSRKGGRRGCRKTMEERGLCMEDISPFLKPGSRRPLSWFDFLLRCSTCSAHCNGAWVWTWSWQLQVKRISHLKRKRCLFSRSWFSAHLSKTSFQGNGGIIFSGDKSAYNK